MATPTRRGVGDRLSHRRNPERSVQPAAKGSQRAAPVEPDDQGTCARGTFLLERGADLHTVQLFLDQANFSTSSRYLKPSKLALHTTIQRIDAQRRESREAAKWEQDLAELRRNLQQGPQKGPHADRIVRQREAGKAVTPPRVNRLGA